MSDWSPSPRLRQVFALMLTELSEKQMAIELGISVHTVHAHAKLLYRALRINSRSELMARRIRELKRESRAGRQRVDGDSEFAEWLAGIEGGRPSRPRRVHIRVERRERV